MAGATPAQSRDLVRRWAAQASHPSGGRCKHPEGPEAIRRTGSSPPPIGPRRESRSWSDDSSRNPAPGSAHFGRTSDRENFAAYRHLIEGPTGPLGHTQGCLHDGGAQFSRDLPVVPPCFDLLCMTQATRRLSARTASDSFPDGQEGRPTFFAVKLAPLSETAHIQGRPCVPGRLSARIEGAAGGCQGPCGPRAFACPCDVVFGGTGGALNRPACIEQLRPQCPPSGDGMDRAGGLGWTTQMRAAASGRACVPLPAPRGSLGESWARHRGFCSGHGQQCAE